MKVGFYLNIKESYISGVNAVSIGTVSQIKKQILNGDELFFIGEDYLGLGLRNIPRIAENDVAGCDLTYAAAAYGLDIVHSHYMPFYIGKRLRCKSVLTIHDLLQFKFREIFGDYGYQMFSGPLKESAMNADKIIADSEWTKKDIIECYGVSEEKICVIYPGMYQGETGNLGGVSAEIRELTGSDYILYVSGIGWNKNQDRLMQAYSILRDRYPDVKAKLVLVGPIREQGMLEREIPKYPRYKDDILYLGYVSKAELNLLYEKALCIAYVSLYEGFGLPILEALNFGKAIVCSNVTSMPEVGGDSVEYCDPYDCESIAGALSQVILNDNRRRELEQKAPGQAQKFSYEKTARDTLALYRELMQE